MEAAAQAQVSPNMGVETTAQVKAQVRENESEMTVMAREAAVAAVAEDAVKMQVDAVQVEEIDTAQAEREAADRRGSTG